MSWWSFTFPVGVTVTGTIFLALQTGLPALRWASAFGYAAPLGAWLIVVMQTSHATGRGLLLGKPAPGSTTRAASKASRSQS
jgi:tellurite resistance protein TehA-like permease